MKMLTLVYLDRMLPPLRMAVDQTCKMNTHLFYLLYVYIKGLNTSHGNISCLNAYFSRCHFHAEFQMEQNPYMGQKEHESDPMIANEMPLLVFLFAGQNEEQTV